MNLMIIESPGKIKKLSAILGDNWKIAASVGHIRDLPQKVTANNIGVLLPDFIPQYEYTERGAGVVAKLKALVKEADTVYLATDPDREGESIGWHLQQCLGLKNPHRITFGEITPKAVKAAIDAPRTVDKSLVAAQEARRVLDRLVGYMVSPKLCEQTGERLSAGRVQSPAVRLVVERERQIKAFRVTNHFGAKLIFADAKTQSEWSAEWITKPQFTSDEAPYFMDREFAAAVAAVHEVTVAAFEEKEARRSPPAPFTTSTMQQAAGVTLGFDPDATMFVAQKLYELGHITYHRTDNPNVSDESLDDIRAEAEKLGLAMANPSRKFKAPEGAQIGHPAITPTHWEAEEAGENEEQRALYRLIRLRAIACQLEDARYMVRSVRLEAAQPVQGKKIEFAGRGRTLIHAGWLKLVESDQTEDKDESAGEESTNPIPSCAPGERFEALRGELLSKKTQAPARFTLPSLVAKLESEGIGRPATYAAILSNIVTRGYIVKNGKFLIPTATGELIVDSLVGKFEFMDLGFTREVEEDLDRIALGAAGYKSTISRVYSQLERELLTLQVSATPKHPCPECGKPLRRIPSKGDFFWGCTGHPDCSTTLPDNKGKPGQRKPREVSNFVCAKCGKPLVHHVKKGKQKYDFWGCSGFRDGCKESYKNLNGEPKYA